MKRYQLFEFEDQTWLPVIFRNMITDAIQFDINTFSIYKPIYPIIKKVMQNNNLTHIIDLCSGGSGPILDLYNTFKKSNFHVSITLTDKYPNREKFKLIASQTDNNINFINKSIDATNLPCDLKGMRTIFTSFHHFKPEIAKQMLQNAKDTRSVIGVFEFTERNILNIIISPLMIPLIMLLTTPFIKPFKLSRIFFTYVLPIVPLLDTWDGIVSHIRTYSKNDLIELTKSIQSDKYNWEIGEIHSTGKFIKLTYLIGFPNEQYLQ